MATQTFKKLSILYVGSDAGIINGLKNQSESVDFHNFPNALNAITWLQDGNLVDGVVCEKELPGRNGLDFHETFVTEVDKGNRIPFVVLSDIKTKDDIKLAFEKGVDDLFQKPVKMEQLCQRMKSLTMLKPRMALVQKEKNEPDKRARKKKKRWQHKNKKRKEEEIENENKKEEG